MSNENSIKSVIAQRKLERARKLAEEKATEIRQSDKPKSQQSDNTDFHQGEISPRRKRGRPAVGKRSDEEWIGRTYYVKRETDLDVEELLVQLKRQGVAIDKSELVERLLAAWVKWHKGENLEIQLDDISPRQK